MLQASSYWDHHAQDVHKPLVLDLLPYLKEETWDADSTDCTYKYYDDL